jgi:energy-coupling factor transport system ATP-binding protein
VRGAPAAERTKRAREALEGVGLDPDQFGARVPIGLSEGEKRRVALASLLADPPRAILLDEPTAGLDPEGRRAVSRVVRALTERGHAVLLASHDLDFVSRVADRAVVLGRAAGGPGGVLADGAVPDIWYDDALLRRAQLPPPDFVSVRAALRGLGIAALAGARDADSLLDAVARGLAGRPRVDVHPAVGDTLRDG